MTGNQKENDIIENLPARHRTARFRFGGNEQPAKWRHYLDRLAQYGYTRKPVKNS